RAGLKAWIFIPENLEMPKVIATTVYAPRMVRVRGTYDDVNRLCAQLAPVRLGDRQRQPAWLLRRRLEDGRLRDHGAARVAAADGGRRSDGRGLARHQATQGIRGVSGRRVGPRGPAAALRRAAERMRADRATGGARWDADRARSPGHDLSLARDRQSGGRTLRRPRAARVGWLGRGGERRGARAGHPFPRGGQRRFRGDRRWRDGGGRAGTRPRGTAPPRRRGGAVHHRARPED